MKDEEQPHWLHALLGTPGSILAFCWGFAEGTLFFIVPDVGFTLTTGLNPKRGLQQLALAVAGAFLAGNVMYSWAAVNPRQAQAAVASVPFAGKGMLEETYRRLETHGARAMLENLLGGVPYKVYAVLAPSQLSYAEFLLWTIPTRTQRMLITWIPAALIALMLRRFDTARRRRIIVTIHAGCWLAIYAYYWWRLWPA